MPAFTFEKIAPPAGVPSSSSSVTKSKQVAAKKSRGLIVQMLDRFALARLHRNQASTTDAPRKRAPPD